MALKFNIQPAERVTKQWCYCVEQNQKGGTRERVWIKMKAKEQWANKL